MNCVISGVGCISSLGRDEETIVKNLKNEKVAIERYRCTDPKNKATTSSRCIEDSETLAPDVPRGYRMDHLNVSYAVIQDALKDAGLSLDDLDRKRVGLSSGSGCGDLSAMQNIVGKDFPRVKPFDLMKILPTAVTGPLSTLLKLKGPAHTVQHACATGLRVITQGMDLITLGRADVVICVSTEKLLDASMRGFDATRALYRGEDIAYASVPFTKERSGFTHGEGGGCVILESEEHYRNRQGTSAYGKAVSFADYSDGEDMTNPSGEGAYSSMSDVLKGLEGLGYYPDFISAHATSTPNGDIIEAKVIHEVVGKDVPVVAFKRLIGHAITACGIIELIYSLYQMKYEFIISNGLLDQDPDMMPIYLPKEQLNKPVESFIKNAFGFGGLNSVLGVIKDV